MSIHEEATVFAQWSMMGIFNNLVMYDQQVRQASLGSIWPDPATGWSWSEDGMTLPLLLRQRLMARQQALYRCRVHLAGQADLVASDSNKG